MIIDDKESVDIDIDRGEEGVQKGRRNYENIMCRRRIQLQQVEDTLRIRICGGLF